MAATVSSVPRKIWQTLAAIKTGVILLILVVILSAAGTVILQRPATDVDEMQRAYSPQVLRLLDGLGLTDVFHAWWFVLLLSLVSLSIVAASIQRFPNAWRYFSRPYKSPDEAFRKALPGHVLIPLNNLNHEDEEAALSTTERILQKSGFRPERIVGENRFSLFGERNRFSEMAVYIVHASLLLIFLGGIVDALYGWKGFLMLTPGSTESRIELRNGGTRTLPFAIRCDGTGEETYTDGTPKRWWSKLAVIDHDREVSKKEIVVNDPLTYQGVRFYQSSFGRTGKLDRLTVTATPASGKAGAAQEISLAMNQPVALDADTTVELTEFIPDYVMQDGHVYARSNDVVNPAVHMIVTSKKAGVVVNVWLPEIEGIAENAASPYVFDPKDLKTGLYTGLQVSHEPGQWSVWGGVILMAIGLTFVFYVSHVRIWVVPVRGAGGHSALWVGGAVNRNRDAFEDRFKQLVGQIEKELQPGAAAEAEVSAAAVHGGSV